MLVLLGDEDEPSGRGRALKPTPRQNRGPKKASVTDAPERSCQHGIGGVEENQEDLRCARHLPHGVEEASSPTTAL